MQNQQKKAIIIGCGIGGAAVALFLKRAGMEVEIYEAREQPEGYSLTLASNGLAVLQELGLDQATLAEGSAVSDSVTITGKGKNLGKIPMAGSGLKSVFIKRVPLGLILSDEAERRGITITRGKRLQDIEVTVQGGKHMVQPFQVWLRDLMTPMMLKLFANEKASRWVYSYEVNWDEKVAAPVPAARS